MEEDSIEIVVVVLSGVRKDRVEIDATLFNDRRETNDFRTRADDDKELELAVVFP